MPRVSGDKQNLYDFADARFSLVNGVLAQLVERLNGIEEVRGSNPLGSRPSPLGLGVPEVGAASSVDFERSCALTTAHATAPMK